MGDFSRSPLEFLAESLRNGYVGVHIEQGVPVLDRDLNLMHDLVSAVARAITTRYIGSGIAAEQDGFEIVEVPGDNNDVRINDFHIKAGFSGQPGTCLVDGIEVTIDKPVNYKRQSVGVPPTVPDLNEPTATQPDPRRDFVFLDVWLSERDGRDDEHLRNSGDVGMQTSVRLRPAWLVRVAEGVDPPAPEPGHAHYRLARLTRPRGNAQITTEMIEDLRQRGLTLTDLEKRVHDLERLRILPAFSDGTQFFPPEAAPTSEVELFGRNFDIGGIPRVQFGAVDAASVGTPTRTGVIAFVPEGLPPGEVLITITTEGGEATSDTPFNVKGPPPDITGIRPTRGKPATSTGPATVVTITGDHFDENITLDTTVTFGDQPADVDEITNTTIVTKVPIISSGEHSIAVTTEWGTEIFAAPFTVVQGIPS